MRAPDPVSTARLRALTADPVRPVAGSRATAHGPARGTARDGGPAAAPRADPPDELHGRDDVLSWSTGPPTARGAPPWSADPAEEEDDAPTQELPLTWAAPQSLGEHVRAAIRSRVPLPLQGGRVDPGRRGLALVLVLGVLAVGVAVALALHGRAHAVPSVAPPVAVSPDALTSEPPVLVDVEGKVHKPGLVRLAAGSRIADAIAAAGGTLPGTDTSGLDLAQKVTDGQQLRVGAPVAAAGGGATAPATASGTTPAGSAGGLIDLNTATADQLDALPRVGPATAQKILDWRSQHGAFTSVSQLQQIAGIGPSTYAQIAPLVTV